MSLLDTQGAFVNASMTSTISSTPFVLTKLCLVSIHYFCTATGSPDGYLTLQVSNEPGTYSTTNPAYVAAPTPVTGVGTTGIGGGGWVISPQPAIATPNWVTMQSFFINGATNGFDQLVLGCKAFRLVYTPVSGTGNLYCYVQAKNYGVPG